MKRLRFFILGSSGLLVSLVSGQALGQGGIGVPPTTIPTTPTQQSQQPTQFVQGGQAGGQQGQQQNQGGGRTTATTSEGQAPTLIDPSAAVDFLEIEDTRNQGFVGATATRINELGFVGTASETSGSAPAEGASFGGGVNSQTGGSFGQSSGGRGGVAQRGGQGGFGNLGANQFGAAGSQNFFEVQRGGLRGSIKPSFETPVVPNDQVTNRFSVSFSRLPESQKFDGQYQVVVSEKKATVTGWVNSQADADRLIAQLRFQPGIYSINNQLQVRQK